MWTTGSLETLRVRLYKRQKEMGAITNSQEIENNVVRRKETKRSGMDHAAGERREWISW